MTSETVKHWLRLWQAWMLDMEAQSPIRGADYLQSIISATPENKRQRTIRLLDQEINDLALEQPWCYQAINYHHHIDRFWRFPRLDPLECYENAVQELTYKLQEDGVILKDSPESKRRGQIQQSRSA
jgi:hypothetical protein